MVHKCTVSVLLTAVYAQYQNLQALHSFTCILNSLRPKIHPNNVPVYTFSSDVTKHMLLHQTDQIENVLKEYYFFFPIRLNKLGHYEGNISIICIAPCGT